MTTNTTTKQIQAFNFNTEAVRIVQQAGDPWFVAIDVCRILGIANHHDAISELDSDERDGVAITDPIGRAQVTNIISESGLYALIFKSRKPEAKAFRKWVTGEVLPAIRQTGKYNLKEERYISLLDEQIARGVRPLTAAKLAYKICFQEPVQPTPRLCAPGFSESLNLCFTGTASEILGEARRRAPSEFAGESVTTFSARLRTMARRGDRRVRIMPKSILSNRALRFSVNF